ISTGCAIGRHFLELPWEILQPVFVERGIVKRNEDLVKIFENHLLSLVTADKSEPADASDMRKRLSALDECIHLLPDRVELLLVGSKSHVEQAGKLLEEGLKLSITDEQANEFRKLLKQAGDQSEVATAMEEIRNLLEGASRSVNKSINDVSANATPESGEGAR